MLGYKRKSSGVCAASVAYRSPRSWPVFSAITAVGPHHAPGRPKSGGRTRSARLYPPVASVIVEPTIGHSILTDAPGTPAPLPSVTRPVMFTATGVSGSSENLNGMLDPGTTIAPAVTVE